MDEPGTDSFTDYVPGGNINKGLFQDMMSIISKYDRPFPESDILNLNNLSVSQDTGFLRNIPAQGCFNPDDEELPHESGEDLLSATALDAFMGGVIAEETRLAEEEEWEDLEEEEGDKNDEEDNSSVENASIVSGAVLRIGRRTEQSHDRMDSGTGLNGENGANQSPRLGISRNLCEEYGEGSREPPSSQKGVPVIDLMGTDSDSSGSRDEVANGIITGIQDLPRERWGMVPPERGLPREGSNPVFGGGLVSVSSSPCSTLGASIRRLGIPGRDPPTDGADPVLEEECVSRSPRSTIGASNMPRWKRHRRALPFRRGHAQHASAEDITKNSSNDESGVGIEDETLYGSSSDESVEAASAATGLPRRCSEADQMERVRLWLYGKRKREASSDDLDTSSPQKSSRVTGGYTQLLREDPPKTMTERQSPRHSLSKGSPKTPRSVLRNRVARDEMASKLLSPVHSVIRSSPARQPNRGPSSFGASREAALRHPPLPESPSSRMLLESWKIQMKICSTSPTIAARSPSRKLPNSEVDPRTVSTLKDSNRQESRPLKAHDGELSSCTPKRKSRFGSAGIWNRHKSDEDPTPVGAALPRPSSFPTSQSSRMLNGSMQSQRDVTSSAGNIVCYSPSRKSMGRPNTPTSSRYSPRIISEHMGVRYTQCDEEWSLTPKKKSVTAAPNDETFIVDSTKVSSMNCIKLLMDGVNPSLSLPEDDEGISTMTTEQDTLTEDHSVDSEGDQHDERESDMAESRQISGEGKQSRHLGHSFDQAPVGSKDAEREDYDDRTISPEFNETYVISDIQKESCNISPGKRFFSQPITKKPSAYKPWVPKRKATPTKSAKKDRGRLKPASVPTKRGDKTFVKRSKADDLGFTGDPFEFLDGDCVPDSFKPCHNSTMIPKLAAPVTNGQHSPRKNRHRKEVVPAGGRPVRSEKGEMRTPERRLKMGSIHETRVLDSGDDDVLVLEYDAEDSPSDKENTMTTVRSNSLFSPSRACGGPDNCEKVFCLRCCDSPVK